MVIGGVNEIVPGHQFRLLDGVEGDHDIARFRWEMVPAPLLRSREHWAAATEVQRRALERLRALPPEARRTAPVRALRQALGFTVSVVAAASGDFALLEELAAAEDPDLRWVARENLNKRRLQRWPSRLDQVRALLR